ncbi:hypothetical protein TIFTF001_008590 [Ficus carica]|uniref:Uncharacterized protein n=1 Tax=Ficus carica TaxID=3494 RepID=A0AA87ZN97_FICCA|nr:hypothetical protein TIFTF001_008590 [Ficus carica]
MKMAVKPQNLPTPLFLRLPPNERHNHRSPVAGVHFSAMDSVRFLRYQTEEEEEDEEEEEEETNLSNYDLAKAKSFTRSSVNHGGIQLD